jgi:hypothetical protein
MEQVTVNISGGGKTVYARVTAWIRVDNPMSWGGHLIATEGHQFFITGGIARPIRYSLRTVDGRGGQIVIVSVHTQTRKVHFEGSGPFGLLQ